MVKHAGFEGVCKITGLSLPLPRPNAYWSLFNIMLNNWNLPADIHCATTVYWFPSFRTNFSFQETILEAVYRRIVRASTELTECFRVIILTAHHSYHCFQVDFLFLFFIFWFSFPDQDLVINILDTWESFFCELPFTEVLNIDDGGAATVRAIIHWQYRTTLQENNFNQYSMNSACYL